MKKIKRVEFNSIIKNKKLPILTLDARWHALFPDEKKNVRIKLLEQKVNKLLKTQGKLVNDIKDMKKLKKSLVSDIVKNMDIKSDSMGKSKEQKMNQNKNYIDELNKKIEEASNQLSKLPYKIREANEELITESVKSIYFRFHTNKKELKNISNWIKDTREELTRKIIVKNEMEEVNKSIYSYIHDVLGAEIIDILDGMANINDISNINPD